MSATGSTVSPSRWASIAPGLVMLAGAGVYAVLEGPGGVTFNATPFSFGLIVLCAGLTGRRRHLLPTAMVLLGWGTAVLLVHAGVVPGERTTPAYMVGIGAGLLATAVLAPTPQRGDWLTTASITAFTGPLGFYLVFDLAVLGRWPAWAVVLVAWSVGELVAGVRRSTPVRR